MANRYKFEARRRKVAALARAIVEYNAHFPADPITAASIPALTLDMWRTLALCATSIEGETVHAPGSAETVHAVAAALSRKAA